MADRVRRLGAGQVGHEDQALDLPETGRRGLKSKRRRLWIILGVIVAIVTAGVIGGLTSALINKNKSSSNTVPAYNALPQGSTLSVSSPRISTSSYSSSSYTTPFQSPSPALPTPTGPTRPGPGGVLISCPASDQTEYTVIPTNSTQPTQTFFRWCNKDFKGADIMNMTATTMEECVMKCATYNNDNGRGSCRGVTWNYLYPQGKGNSYCWLKEHVGDLGDYGERETGVLVDL
ncbi:hypothetical protein BCR34DRAFT_618831 [Clohesyomyces aquaticus]|uniref:Apple domain-containing protein n=1 Tax=Clohesyomyces aquaticus TaxID=1231657 RepID=A0A1Y1YNS6_9PLEO|nr:hypothetical protein BCR34DRAFT_618831 [Clohesyomyces aquaticus]